MVQSAYHRLAAVPHRPKLHRIWPAVSSGGKGGAVGEFAALQRVAADASDAIARAMQGHAAHWAIGCHPYVKFTLLRGSVAATGQPMAGLHAAPLCVSQPSCRGRRAAPDQQHSCSFKQVVCPACCCQVLTILVHLLACKSCGPGTLRSVAGCKRV